MKIKTSDRTAYINFRTVSALLLCALGAALGVFAFPSLLRLESSTQKPSVVRRGGGSAALNREPSEVAQATAQNQANVPYTGAHNDIRPVAAVRSGELRHLHPINPANGQKHDHPEPIRPAPPSQSGGLDGPLQTAQGQQFSAPSPSGTGFDGVGTGTAGFVPSSNPPDVNGRVGATHFVQWNNTSFAGFDKATGALQYGPAAGNTLFQSLGGVCATHNDGDPVVSYDILAGRWVLSQFVVGGPAGSFSHQCVAVSLTGDATGSYYLYDFLTDGTNFVDYPHIGVWPDGYYMSAHVFNAAGTSNVAARVYVFERAKMLLGQPARMQSKDLPKDGSGFQYGFLPADLDSVTPPPAGAQEYVIGPNAQFTNRTDISRVAVTWGVTPTITLTSTTNTTVGVGNSKSGPSTIPGIYRTGRLTGDTAGTMGAETTVQAGAGVQFSTGATGSAGNRWGDYSAMTIDPVDQCTFWYTNEYLKTNGA